MKNLGILAMLAGGSILGYLLYKKYKTKSQLHSAAVSSTAYDLSRLV